MAPYGLQMTDRIEIVVSRYNESLGWTLYPPFNQFRYTVYNDKNLIQVVLQLAVR